MQQEVQQQAAAADATAASLRVRLAPPMLCIYLFHAMHAHHADNLGMHWVQQAWCLSLQASTRLHPQLHARLHRNPAAVVFPTDCKV